MGDSVAQARAELVEHLRARRGEIEQAVLTRVHAISDSSGARDQQYLEGLRAAVGAGLDYGIEGVGRGSQRPPVPVALLAQARRAARSGVSIDTVLRRYFAGYALLGDFLVAEVKGELMDRAALKCVLRDQASLFDRLIAAVSEEFRREAESHRSSAEQARSERVERLLTGELLDASDIPYDFDAFHIGLAAVGPHAAQAIRELVAPLDCRLLLVSRDERTVWAWLGGRRPLDFAELCSHACQALSPGHRLALGQPGEGLAEWRLTHRQAVAALPVALRGEDTIVRYADVALVASALQDDLLSTSLRKLYLAPLEQDGDGGETARQTLRAYLTVGSNASSTAAALGVNRRTVARRLRVIEEQLGRHIDASPAAMEIALHLDQVDRTTAC